MYMLAEKVKQLECEDSHRANRLAQRLLSRSPSPMILENSISWRTVSSREVEVTFEVRNFGLFPTIPEHYVIEAAAFGAFIPAVPIARVAVEALDPAQSKRVSVTLPRKHLDFAKRITRAITPISLDTINALQKADWIGNLNIYPERHPEQSKEKHFAFDLRVKRGSIGMLRLVILEDDAKVCQRERLIRTVTSNPAWSVVIHPARPSGSHSSEFDDWRGVRGRAIAEIVAPNWVRSQAVITLEIGRLSGGKVVPIEFEFETTDGESDQLGCVAI